MENLEQHQIDELLAKMEEERQKKLQVFQNQMQNEINSSKIGLELKNAQKEENKEVDQQVVKSRIEQFIERLQQPIELKYTSKRTNEINFALIKKYCIPQELIKELTTEEDIIKEIIQLKTLHLQQLYIREIKNLDTF